MNSSELVMQVLLGGILGLAGQGIRVVSGLKKLHDKAGDAKTFAQLFEVRQFLVSLFIGFIAGVLAVLSMEVPDDGFDRNSLVVLLGAGYAGTDFIEAFMSKKQLK